MRFGPIVWRELIVGSRRRSMYVGRVTSASVLLAVLGLLEVATLHAVWDVSTLAGQTRFALAAFGAIAGLLVIPAMMAVPMELATTVAAERDGKTLDALLATALTDTALVTGKLVAGLARFAAGALAGLPVMVIVAACWGVDLRLVGLLYLGVATTAFAGGAFGLYVSTGARGARRATGPTLLGLLAWAYLPFLLVVFLPRVWPGTPRWLISAALWLLAGSPTGPLLNLGGVIVRGTLVEAVARMAALEVAGGLALVAWTCWRFRARCRAVDDREGRSWLRRLGRLRPAKRPPCGDDPILWYEIHATRGVGPWQRRLGRVLGSAAILGYAVFLGWFAVPAVRELATIGYRAGPAGLNSLDLDPLARAIVRLRVAPPAIPPGAARVELNVVLREVTVTIMFVSLLILTGFAAEGVAGERVRDTWSGLLATPLTGAEVLRAKMLGAAWRAGGAAASLALPWTLGLLAGAVHPLGWLAAVVNLAVTAWFLVALGTYASLHAREPKQATGWVLPPVVVLACSGLLPFLLPEGLRSVFWASLSPPWVGAVGLVSYEDVRDAFRTAPYGSLAALRVPSGESALALATSFLVGWTIQATAAAWLTWAAVRGFDRAVGRPERSGAR